MRNFMAMKTFLACAAAALCATAIANAQTFAIQNAKVYTMVGPDAGPIENGDIIIRDGVIAAIGQDLTPPEGATVIDAKGRIVTPGIFAPWSELGLVEIGLDKEANDSSPQGEFPLSASLNAVDAFNPQSTLIAINRAGGITRAVTAPDPGDKMFGGEGAIVSLSGGANSITRANVVQSVAMGYAGAARNGDTRLGSWAELRAALDEAKAYGANPAAYAMRPRMDGLALADLKALGPVARGAEPLAVYVNSVAEIRNLIRLKRDYGVKPIIIGGTQAWMAAKELAAANIPVILNPFLNLPSQFEDLAATQANAARLAKAGVTIAFYDPPSGTHNLRLLTQLAGNAVANGLPYADGLKALTVNPAKIFSVDQRFGALEIGKAGDIVVWDGDPLEVSTRPVAVFIDGRATSLVNRQTRLRDRYKDLSRGNLPFAYRGASN